LATSSTPQERTSTLEEEVSGEVTSSLARLAGGFGEVVDKVGITGGGGEGPGLPDKSNGDSGLGDLEPEKRVQNIIIYLD